MKNYVFYPLLRTEFFKNLPEKIIGDKPIEDKNLKKKRKKTAKTITTFSAMFVMWFTVGLWHGGAWKYIIGSGLLHWFYILWEEAPDNLWKKLETIFHIDSNNIIYRILCGFRTYLLVCFGFLFFNAPSLRVGIIIVRHLFAGNQFMENETDLGLMGLELKDWLILAMGIAVVLLVDYIGTRTDIRRCVAALPLVPRWILYYGFIFAVILLGQYGPGFSAAEFIYRGF